MAGYPSPVLITGAGSELAQGLRARLEARGVSCFMACRSEKSLLACRGKGQAAGIASALGDPSPLVTLGDVASYTAWAAGIREKA